MIYGDFYLLPAVEYTSRTSFAACTPRYAKLEVARGVVPPEPSRAEGASLSTGEIVIKISIKNVGGYDASKASVTDTLPDGFVYRWNSATAIDHNGSAREVSVSGANPYCFAVGAVRKTDCILLTYSALPFKEQSPPAPPGADLESTVTVFKGDLLSYQTIASIGGAEKER